MSADRWSRPGRANLPTTLACTCSEGIRRCMVCETESETELACQVGPDAARPMPAPVRTAEDYAYHARIVRRVAAVGMLVWLVVVTLLRLCGARTLTP